MSTTWNGNHTPLETDMWNLVTDMRTQAVLNNRVIPVYSKTERDGLATLAPGGTVPEGTVVLRMDQSGRGAVFDVFMDGGWVPGDTGVQTTGVSIIPSGNATLGSYSLRRKGTSVVARIDATYTGPTRTGATGSGDFVDTLIFTLDRSWEPIWATYDITWTIPGNSLFFGHIDPGGGATISGTAPGVTLKSGDSLRLDGSWETA